MSCDAGGCGQARVATLGAGKPGLSILDVLYHSASPALTIVTGLQPFRPRSRRMCKQCKNKNRRLR
ncbi:MAG: hypothetical protein JW918_13885 [Anaerolineae bacterium]|nr:hypothetical protein [Anaerolineae bacterium]